MMLSRARKLLFSLSRPRCWRALALGVAPVIEHREVLAAVDPDLVLDVGANRGQFTLLARLCLPAVPVIAFEPIPGEAETFGKVHGNDAGVRLVRSALGDQAGAAAIHLSRSRDSSSLLPIGRRQTEMFPGTEEVGVLQVPVARLDDFRAEWRGRSRIFLKLDVQGFELPVLRGGPETLRQCRWVYAECSHVALYEGQQLYDEVAGLLAASGFHPIRRLNESNADGRLVQADYLFERG